MVRVHYRPLETPGEQGIGAGSHSTPRVDGAEVARSVGRSVPCSLCRGTSEADLSSASGRCPSGQLHKWDDLTPGRPVTRPALLWGSDLLVRFGPAWREVAGWHVVSAGLVLGGAAGSRPAWRRLCARPVWVAWPGRRVRWDHYLVRRRSRESQCRPAPSRSDSILLRRPVVRRSSAIERGVCPPMVGSPGHRRSVRCRRWWCLA